MSFSFTVVKDADGIHIGPVSEGMLVHVPDGEFRISGHKHVQGTAPDAIAIYSPCGSASMSAPNP